MAVEEVAVGAAAREELADHRQGDDEVGARAHRQMKIRLLGDRSGARIEDDEFGAGIAGGLDRRHEMDTRHGGIAAPDHDEPGGGVVVEGDPFHLAVQPQGCAAGGRGADGARQAGGAEAVEEQGVGRVLREVAVRAAVAEGENGLASEAIAGLDQPLRGEGDRLLPGERFEDPFTLLSDAHHGFEDALLAVELVRELPHLGADVAFGDRIAVAGTVDLRDPPVLNRHFETASVRAVERAGRGDFHRKKSAISGCRRIHRVRVEVGDAGAPQDLVVDEEVAGALARRLGEDPVCGVGEDLRLAAVRRRHEAAEHGERCGVDRRARPECVDRHAVAPKLFGHAEDAHAHAVLGHGVGDVPGEPLRIHVERRGHVEDVRVLRPLEVRYAGLRAEEGPAHVDREHQIETLHRGVESRREADRRGVVDQNVDAAEARPDRFHGGLHLRLLADVAGDRQSLAAGALDLLGGGVDRSWKAGVRLGGLGENRDVGAVARGAQPDGEPDATGCAGDHEGLACKGGHGYFLPGEIPGVNPNLSASLPGPSERFPATPGRPPPGIRLSFEA